MGVAPPGTIAAAVESASRRLEAAGVDSPAADARLLLAHALEVVPTWVFAHAVDEMPERAVEPYEELVAARERRVPLQHLTGVQEFWSLRFAVGPQALIPRPETELLVEAALAALDGVARPRVADVGTGSGCLAVALASELPLARLLAVDVSPEALALARRNALDLGFDERIEWLEGDLVAPLREGGPVQALVANLPYVSEDEWAECDPEVREHDPRLALVAGSEGTELIERLVDEAPSVIATGGWLGLEVGWTQAERVKGLLERRGYTAVRSRRDFAGIERVVEGRPPEA
jgi:release factor glutamine methyltransferase